MLPVIVTYFFSMIIYGMNNFLLRSHLVVLLILEMRVEALSSFYFMCI